MKKALLITSGILLCLQSYGQNIKFDKLLHLLKEKDVKTYITSKPFEFSEVHRPFPFDSYIKNGNTPNEEIIGYGHEKNMPYVEYSTRNVAFMYAIIKQIKFPLILKSDDPNSSLYYQFGDTHMMIMIDIYKKKGNGRLSMYRK